MWIGEYNLSYDNNGILMDFQSRIIECESWSRYVSYYVAHNNNPHSYVPDTLNNVMLGTSIRKNDKIEKLKFTEDRLSCILRRFPKFYDRRVAVRL